MLCPACATELPDDDLFCESCGVSLTPAIPAPSADCKCGASPAQVDDDGFCTRCGRRVVRPASDHIEESLSQVFAAVSDRGLRHDRNEDRFSLWMSEKSHVLVVCDGVSATRNSEIASSTVAEETVASLSHAWKQGRIEDPESAMRNAIKSGAAKLAARMPKDEPESAPSTTVVAALLDGPEVILGWIGDSRAYWIDAAGALPLTRDHSWVNDVVAAGQMSVAEAEASPRSHGITRWIGADADADLNPEIARHRIEGPGTLLLCTDGLWNYAKTNEAIGNLLREACVDSQDALEIARRLVQFANDQGGQDNITAALLRFP